MAYEYARRKASLVIVARRESRLCEVAEKARRLGSPDVLLFCADVSDKDACKKFVDEAITHFARLDHLVNNAGIASICPFERAKEFKNFTHVMQVIKSIPLMSTEPCAKAIVDGACQGKRYVTEPQFYRVLILLKFFCPELFDWFYRNIHLARLKHMQMTSSSNHESHSLDYTIVE
ncbi:hypothetical protein U1Q18_017329 [Sarracenia purpurea var. burkii]